MKGGSASIGDCAWRNRSAVQLDNGTVRLVVVDEGGRIVSLLDRHSGREWLKAPSGAVLSGPPRSGTRFVETDHFGWDEMLPTVDPCLFPVEPFAGEMLPDHGTLWSCTWELIGTEPQCCTQVVHCTVPPCVLRRTIALQGACVRIEYELASKTDRPLPVLWAAHPQFVAQGVRVRIEPSPSFLVDVTAGDDVVLVPFTGDLRVDRDAPLGQDRMYYVPPEEPVESVVLEANNGDWLRCRVDTTVCPYIGLWLDRGHYNASEVVAVEPATAYYDSLERAVRTNHVVWVAPGEPLRWWMAVELSTREP